MEENNKKFETYEERSKSKWQNQIEKHILKEPEERDTDSKIKFNPSTERK